jgi:hypothetical protein
MSQHDRAQLHAGTVEGLLLYPLVDEAVDVALSLKGQLIRVRTINLSTSWSDIRAQLLELLRVDSFQQLTSELVSVTSGARGIHEGASSGLISN